MQKSRESFQSRVRFLPCSHTVWSYSLLSSPSCWTLSLCFACWGRALGFLFCMLLAKCSRQHWHTYSLFSRLLYVKRYKAWATATSCTPILLHGYQKMQNLKLSKWIYARDLDEETESFFNLWESWIQQYRRKILTHSWVKLNLRKGSANLQLETIFQISCILLIN